MVVAFGQILPQAVLDVPARGSINVHGSLLPRYRGAAPIAVGDHPRRDARPGITTFQMDEGMDTGPVLLTAAHADRSRGDGGRAGGAAAPTSGAELLLDTLARLDTLTPVASAHAGATLAPRLKKSDGQLDWGRPAAELAQPRARLQSVAGRRTRQRRRDR